MSHLHQFEMHLRVVSSRLQDEMLSIVLLTSVNEETRAGTAIHQGLTGLLDAMGRDGFVIDASGVILAATMGLTEWTGLDESELMSSTVAAALPREARVWAREHLTVSSVEDTWSDDAARLH